MNTKFENYYVYFTVFVTGAVILILEILGTRIIAPFYGATTYVWSSLITVTLIALALGYYIGGWLADRIPRSDILYMVVSFSAISIIFIPLIKNFVLIQTNILGVKYGALASAGVLFTIPLLLLGIVTPYAIKLRAKGLDKLGVTAGGLYGIATIGSFIGAIITGFYLIPNIGINSIIFLSSGLLLFTVIIWFLIFRKKILIAGITAAVILIIFANLSLSKPTLENINIVYEIESPYAKLKVIDEYYDGINIGLRYIFVDGATHTRYDLNNKEFTFPYLRLFEKAVHYSNSKDILVIGLGGGGVNKILEKYEVNIDSVEIDPKIIEISREYFNFSNKVILDDGRHFIKNTANKYDIVYLDVYSGYSIYPYLFSKEAFNEIKGVLNEEGILVINTLGYESHLSSDDKLILSIYKTLKQIFSNVKVKTTGYGLTSFVFYATDSDFEVKDNEFISIEISDDKLTNGTVLTDNYNPIDFFALRSSKEWRNFEIKRFGNVLL